LSPSQSRSCYTEYSYNSLSTPAIFAKLSTAAAVLKAQQPPHPPYA